MSPAFLFLSLKKIKLVFLCSNGSLNTGKGSWFFNNLMNLWTLINIGEFISVLKFKGFNERIVGQNSPDITGYTRSLQRCVMPRSLMNISPSITPVSSGMGHLTPLMGSSPAQPHCPGVVPEQCILQDKAPALSYHNSKGNLTPWHGALLSLVSLLPQVNPCCSQAFFLSMPYSQITIVEQLPYEFSH